MADDGIYRKTEKGRTEIATRANKLGMRERTMLIMVDDKTPRSGHRLALSGTGWAAGFCSTAAATSSTLHSRSSGGRSWWLRSAVP